MTETEKRVLFVEDDKSISGLVATFLGCEGYSVTVKEDPQDVLESVRSNKPDVILMDYNLPGMTGLVLSQKLNEDPETGGIPTALVSASNRLSEESFQNELKEAGIRWWLSKPFELDDLVTIVAEMISEGQKPKYPEKNLSGPSIDLNPTSLFRIDQAA